MFFWLMCFCLVLGSFVWSDFGRGVVFWLMRHVWFLCSFVWSDFGRGALLCAVLCQLCKQDGGLPRCALARLHRTRQSPCLRQLPRQGPSEESLRVGLQSLWDHRCFASLALISYCLAVSARDSFSVLAINQHRSKETLTLDQSAEPQRIRR